MGFIGKILSFTFLHAGQVDKPTPSFGSSAAFKTAIDSQAIQLQTALNGLIDALNSTTSGSSGAKNLGATAITDLAGTDVQTLLESLRNALKSVTNGSSGADFVSSAAITGVSGATVYAQLASLKTLIDAVFTKAQMQATTAGTSGSELVGSAAISGVTGATIYAQLANLKTQLDGLVVGTVPDRSIAPIKLTFDPSPFGATTGTANTYAVTLNPAPAAYVDGMAVSVKINVDATAASTLNVNGLGAKPLKKVFGTDVTNLKTNGVYTFRYNSTTGNFILQGEGGSGNATAADLLVGKTASVDSGDITGTMPNNGALNVTPIASAQNFGSGYYSGVTVGAQGSNINSIQRGTVSTGTGSTTTTVTITAVVPANSIVLINYCFKAGANQANTDANTAEITNSTTITFTHNTTGFSQDIAWTVIEFNNVKSKQTGTIAVNASPQAVTVTSVTTNKSILVASFRSSAASSLFANYECRYELSSATNINFYGTTAVITAAWQLIEFN